MHYLALAFLILLFALIGTITKIIEHDPHGEYKARADKALYSGGKLSYFTANQKPNFKSEIYFYRNLQCALVTPFPFIKELRVGVEDIGRVRKLRFASNVRDPKDQTRILPLHVEVRFENTSVCGGATWAYNKRPDANFPSQAYYIIEQHKESQKRVVSAQPQKKQTATSTPRTTQSKSTRKAKTQSLKLSRNDWRRVQAGLKKLGYDPGPIDGIPGRQTSLAILEWQTGNFRVQTGVLTRNQANAILRKAADR